MRLRTDRQELAELGDRVQLDLWFRRLRALHHLRQLRELHTTTRNPLVNSSGPPTGSAPTTPRTRDHETYTLSEGEVAGHVAAHHRALVDRHLCPLFTRETHPPTTHRSDRQHCTSNQNLRISPARRPHRHRHPFPIPHPCPIPHSLPTFPPHRTTKHTNAPCGGAGSCDPP